MLVKSYFKGNPTKNNFIYEFQFQKLKEAYRIEDNRKIYQLYDQNFDFKLRKLDTRLQTYLTGYNKEVLDNLPETSDTYFIYMLIDKKGIVEKFDLINSINPKIDEVVKKGLARFISQNPIHQISFKKMKVDGESVSYELVAPLSINVKRFFNLPSQPLRGYHYDNFFRMHQQDLFHQQMMNNIQNISVPKF